MKYLPSYDGQNKADFKINIRFTKEEVERIRCYLKKKGKRGLDIEVKRFIVNMASTIAGDEIIDFLENINE